MITASVMLCACSESSGRSELLSKRDAIKNRIMALEMSKRYSLELKKSSILFMQPCTYGQTVIGEEIGDARHYTGLYEEENARYHQISREIDTTYNYLKIPLLEELKVIESRLK